MEHESYLLLTHAYFDGELDASASRELERHLLGCPDCEAELDELKNARANFAALAKAPVPFGFKEKVMRRVWDLAPSPAPKERGHWLDWLGLPAWELAAALSVTLLVGFYFAFDYASARTQRSENALQISLGYDSAGDYAMEETNDEL